MKKVGGTCYVHKSALNQLDVHQRYDYLKARREIPKKWKWDILSINGKEVAFIQCPEWDTVDEPVVGDRYVVVKDGGATLRKACTNNPLIFHRKYLFVNPCYKGFDYEKNVRRGEIMDGLNLDTKRIGRLNYWQKILAEHEELQ